MKSVLYIVCGFILLTLNVSAEEKRHGPKAIEVTIKTGSKEGDIRFIPDNLQFERGKYYKLVINNPSEYDHYFSSDAFATHIFTRKVEVLSHDGKTLTEIHGDIHDIELKPGTTVEWFFYPMTNGENLKLFCHKNDHEELGMVGSIDIVGSAPFTK